MPLFARDGDVWSPRVEAGEIQKAEAEAEIYFFIGKPRKW
jgi:hypothetical protein